MRDAASASRGGARRRRRGRRDRRGSSSRRGRRRSRGRSQATDNLTRRMRARREAVPRLPRRPAKGQGAAADASGARTRARGQDTTDSLPRPRAGQGQAPLVARPQARHRPRTAPAARDRRGPSPSYFSLQRGVKVANERVPDGTSEALTHQDSLLLSTPTNILLLGTDHANLPGREGERSDSIMLIRTDPSRHRIVYLSIPRDLRVPIEGVGDTKINAAMSAGGAPLAIKTVASYTGLPINHVITVDFPRFREVIDALGGITINVPERILSNFDCPLKTQAECDALEGLALRQGRAAHERQARARLLARAQEPAQSRRHRHHAHRAPAGRPPGDAAQDDERLDASRGCRSSARSS